MAQQSCNRQQDGHDGGGKSYAFLTGMMRVLGLFLNFLRFHECRSLVVKNDFIEMVETAVNVTCQLPQTEIHFVVGARLPLRAVELIIKGLLMAFNPVLQRR
jgi:hypothetical protein